MDKFDEFLSKRTKDENKEFVVPESLDLRIEETLKHLSDDKKEKWYRNRKIISMAACFALICLVGLRYVLPNSMSRMNKSSASESSSDKSQLRDMPDIESYRLENRSGELIINANEVKSLNMKSLAGEPKYKFVDKAEDIKKLIDTINTLNKSEIIDQGISEWDFLIQTNGSVNHSIMIKEKFINIDDKWYSSDEDISKIIENIYSTLNYEEKDIKYCNVTY